jgi:Predicted pyridoxal phosphate-dependent enzyme apparently involved in regulation of cell wall biogenesis
LELSKGLNKDVYNIHAQPNQPMNVFPVTLKDEKSTKKVKNYLEKNSIEYGNYYPIGLHEFPISKFIQNKKDFKTTEIVKKTIVTLPCHPNLNKNKIKKIINILNEI